MIFTTRLFFSYFSTFLGGDQEWLLEKANELL